MVKIIAMVVAGEGLPAGGDRRGGRDGRVDV